MVRVNHRALKYEDDVLFNDWIARKKGSYRNNCQTALVNFMLFLEQSEGWENVTPSMLLARHKKNRKSDDNKVKYEIDDLMEKSFDWLKKKFNLDHNSTVTQLMTARGFFSFHHEALESKIPAPHEKPKDYHTFKQRDLIKMVRLANPEEKAVIMLGKDLGIRVSVFVALERQDIMRAYEDSEGEEEIFPLEIQIQTKKARGKPLAIGHISEETFQALNEYWDSLKGKANKSRDEKERNRYLGLYESKYVFPSKDGSKHISQDRANDVLKNTFARSFPDRADRRIRFHELRSFKMSTLSNAGVNQWHISRMVGKKVDPSILTYLTSINLKEDFKRAFELMKLTGLSPENHHNLEKIYDTIAEQDKRIKILETTNKALDKKIEKLNSNLIQFSNAYYNLLDEKLGFKWKKPKK